MSGPFKMKGHPLKASPCKDRYTRGSKPPVGLSLTTTGVSLTSKTGSKAKTEYTISPGIRVGDFRAGASFSQDISGSKAIGLGTTKSDKTFGARASYTLAPKGSFKGGFKGQLSGDISTKSGASGKLSLGWEKSGGTYCKGGKLCSDASTEVGLTGGYHAKDKSISLGGKVRRGMFELSGSHNLKTKQNKVTLGIKPFK